MASIAEIRARYPQYQDMSDQQLADALYTKFYSDMPRPEFDAKIGLTAEPPPLMEPGSGEYARWALEQARAGKKLPMVSQHTEFEDKPNGPMDKAFAAAGSFLEGVPIAGPSLIDLAKQGRAAVQGMTPEDVSAEFDAAKAANPISSGVGTVAGAVLPLSALGTLPGVSRVLGMSGGIGSQTVMGGLSGGALSFGDTLARGGSMEDATGNGLLGVGVGGAAPWVLAGAGKALGALTGKTAPKAAKNVGRALKDDGIDPASIPSRLNQLGPDAMLMDLGPNLQAQAGALAAVPGSAQKGIREAVTQRAHPMAKTARVTDDVRATVGQGPDVDLLKQRIIADQSAAATPLYDAVRDVPLPISGNFKFVLQTPLGKDAFRRAAQLAANDGKRVNGLTVGLVDYAKRALDDIAASAARSGNNNAARQASQMANLLKSETDKVVPGYRAAREAFAGPAAVLDAIDAGTQVFSKDMTPAQLKRTLDGMTAGERDAFLQGTRSYIEGQLGNAVNDVGSLRNLFRKGWNEAKLRLVLGDDIADDLLKRIDREMIYGKTVNAVEGNSETARRTASMGEVAPEKRDVSQANAIGLVLAAINKARQMVAGAGQKKVNEQMAKLLAGQAGAGVVRQLTNGMRPPLPGVLAPGSFSDLLAVPEQRKPLEIMVRGGNPALAPHP